MRGVILIGLVLAACTPPASNAPVPDGGVVRTGVVRVVGSAPMNTAVVLQESGGTSVYVVGPLTNEIANTAGAAVRISGVMRENYLEATSYTIESVNGRPVHMGTVERTASGGVQLRTTEGEVIPLVGATDRFRPGQKVWVQGPTEPAVRVQTYGVLTP